jgi:hypothetical protein
VATRIYFARDHSLDVKEDLVTLVERARNVPHAVETSTEHGEEYVVNWANVWYCSPILAARGPVAVPTGLPR